MDYYKESLDSLPPRRSTHHRDRDDYFDHRDRFDFDREIGSYRDPYLPSDDHYRMVSRPTYPPPSPSHDKDKIGGAYVMFGSVALELINPFDPKPRCRLKPEPCHTVFVGSLPDNCAESHLTDLFSNCGSIAEVRVSRGRNFGHVQFSLDSSVERAMELSGCNVRLDNSHTRKDTSRIHVDYAQDKQEVDLRRRIQENEIFPYTSGNITMISNDLHRDDAFIYAAKNVMNWLSKGSVDEDSLAKLYGLVSTVSTHGRKLNKMIETKDEEELEFKVKKKLALQKLLCEIMIDVFDATPSAKTWNYFTKGQRKSIFQWKDQAVELQQRLKYKIEENDRYQDEPPYKIRKIQRNESEFSSKNLEADLERAVKEIEQLKTDREVAIEKKDKRIMQLKTLMAKLKKTCPEEWEKSLGVGNDSKTKEDSLKEESSKEDSLKEDSLKEDSLKDKEDEGDMSNSDDEGGEVIDEVSLEDLKTVINNKASANSLASAAAAYAKIKKNVGSKEMAGLGLSEAEVAIVSVLAAFLTVHPLGATSESITAYFQTFNSDYNSYYLESLLCRLTKVFQRSGDGGGKWWFLGFQTCYDAPSAVKMEASE